MVARGVREGCDRLCARVARPRKVERLRVSQFRAVGVWMLMGSGFRVEEGGWCWA